MGSTEDKNSSLEGQASTLGAILDSAVDAIVTIDGAGTIKTVNPAAERLFGYRRADFIGRNVHFLMPQPYQAEHDRYIQNYIKTGHRKIIGIGREVSGRRRDGTVFPMHLAVSEFEIEGERHFTGIIHDLTAHKETENALRQAQKMDALGQLTGGIAHDFNNLLTVIIGNVEMLSMRLDDGDDRELADEALEAAELGARLTSRLLAFARRSHLEPEVVNLNTFVVSLTDMLHRTLGETIQLSTTLNPSLWSVRVDPSQVESAIVNLAVNARDAMARGGRLMVETDNVHIDEQATDADTVAPGDYVRLSVTDTGSGMSQAVRERAFEPFFTTKEKGRGTGLGLSMVYGFVKQSGGHASIASDDGSGTTVNLYLPRHDTTAERPSQRLAHGAVMGDGERILVVEDDARVRRLTRQRLIELGYDVIEAESGDEAVEILKSGEAIDLVFSDIVMPGGMSGHDLAKIVAADYPAIRLLLTSGYADTLVDGQSDATPKVLRKPYRLADLADAIASAIASR